MTTATGFNAIVGQEQPITLLKAFIRHGTLPHALLFSGDDGVGKQTTATAFAMACNCERLAIARLQDPCHDAIDACGECIPCRKIAANHHPDIIYITPHASVIRIDRIRELLQTLALKPNEARQRVVILRDAHAMNAEAGNALLKVLEEPPRRTLLILTTHQPTDLLPTVVSRCRHIRFLPLAPAQIEGLLRADGDIDPQAAGTAAALCGGSVTRARALLDERWQRRRQWLIRTLDHLCTESGGQLRAWLALSEKLSKKKELIAESLEIVKMWLRDGLVAGCAPEQVLNRDYRDRLTAMAEREPPSRLLAQIDAVERAASALKFNTNTRLTLDAMVLQMAGATGRYA